MYDFSTQILTALVSIITAGSLTFLFTIKSTRQKARAEAMKEVQDVYQETIQDLREDKNILKEEKTDLLAEITDWKEKYVNLTVIVNRNTKDIDQLKIKAKKEQCLRFDCKERIYG